MKRKKNPVQLNCIVQGSVKTGLEKIRPLAVKSSVGPEADALSHLIPRTLTMRPSPQEVAGMS
jgi:hypothetical protein